MACHTTPKDRSMIARIARLHRRFVDLPAPAGFAIIVALMAAIDAAIRLAQ